MCAQRLHEFPPQALQLAEYLGMSPGFLAPAPRKAPTPGMHPMPGMHLLLGMQPMSGMHALPCVA